MTNADMVSDEDDPSIAQISIANLISVEQCGTNSCSAASILGPNWGGSAPRQISVRRAARISINGPPPPRYQNALPENGSIFSTRISEPPHDDAEFLPFHHQ